jgi:hypothetical protein
VQREGRLGRRGEAHLEEANDETNDTVGAEAARVDFVHPSLREEGFDDEDEGFERWEGADVRVDDLAGGDSVELVEGDVDWESA